ncbi:ABC transporter substrate-binding protein [Streptacidiphilus carbonis]|uniref:ABC transporter substrate-binding protein n=1 Tax=Streptacidiphilus carbonis TaxID=105422 RepID=UPI0005AAE090|nr:ABC transporter substrate-binding protein [Streptacidiphilus carbonis]
MKTGHLAATAAALLLIPLSACGGQAAAGSAHTVTITVGYQSRTINTVTAGTLLRSLGYFEQDLAALGRRTGVSYKVDWQDYSTGAPITAGMVAGKIDIGSMGDYPLLLNAARGKQLKQPTELVSVTGYNLRGALNMVVAKPDSPLTGPASLAGHKVSTSIGSAADGTLVQALQRIGVDPNSGISKLNQQPAVGASALQAGSADALAQFVAWPGLLVFQKQAKLVYDGSALDIPTFHGVTVRSNFAKSHSDLVDTFLKAQIQATDYLHAHPLAAAESVAKATGLPPEVVYLYNGAGGLVSFDTTLKPQLLAALKQDVPVLRSEGSVKDVDVDGFVNDSFLKQALGSGYQAAVARTANPAPISGTDPVCGGSADDPATASEAWPAGAGAGATVPFTTPTCLLKYLRQQQAVGRSVRAAYVPDAATGTRWFAEDDAWVENPSAAATARWLPFTTPAAAQQWSATHPGSRTVGYQQALAGA